MHVTFRADASSRIGHGHVMRCLALATALDERGVRVSFVCREHPGDLRSLIERDFRVHRLPAERRATAPAGSNAYSEWLGASWEEDARDTLGALNQWGIRPDWLIVDHYAIDKRWETCLRPWVGRIMVIDDLADRDHDCDLLLDHNFGASAQGRYAKRVPPACGLLLGPDYALLHPTYANMHERVSPRQGSISRLLVSFGGADRANLTGRALAAVATVEGKDIDVDVVLPAGSAHEDAVRIQAKRLTNCRIHSGLSTLAPLMANADLAIGAAGTASLERLCLGLPTVVITLAENQRAGAMAMSELGLIRWLGDQNDVDDALLSRTLQEIVAQGTDPEWSRRCLDSVDGKGSARVAGLLNISEATPLRARYATGADEALLLQWANDPGIRRSAFSPAQITPESHHTWFQQRLRDADSCHIYVIETEAEIPIGQVRFERSGEAWRIDYAIAPDLRRRRLGRRLLYSALKRLSEREPNAVVFGDVKRDNHPSRRVFESLGFHSRETGEVVRYELVFEGRLFGSQRNQRSIRPPDSE